jgi:lipoprotein-anchoring transpeptidase ErfK/SrfK
VIHPDTPDSPIVSDFVRGRLYSSASAWSVISIAVGAALALLGAGPAKAAYYHNYGYYDYGYRAPPPRHLRSASRKRTKKPRDVQAKKVESKPIKGPLTIVVSIGEQRVRVFDSTTLIAESPSSTGTRAYPTPMGVFSIIQKDRIHYSNLYQNAPMPYMQRLTWSGTAMHTGVLPGYAASHGCIRLPNSFAARLWKITKLGTRVIVARHGLQPAPITHAKLDLLKRKPAEATQVVEGATGKTMATEGPVATDGAGTPMPNITAMEPKPAMPVLAKPKPIINEAYLMVPAAKLLIAPDPAIADPTSAYPATSGAAPKPLKPGPVAIFISKKEGKLFVRKGFEPVFDIPIKIENPDTPLGTHVYTATQAKEGSLGMDWIALSLPPEARVASRTDKRSRARGAKHQVPAPPVPTATADEALDRVELPAEVLERLAEMLSPGASLIISDKGLGPQTGKGTNFIVLSR